MVGAWEWGAFPGGWVSAWEGGCLGGWVHKGVSEGVIEWVAWFGGLSVCSLVRGMVCPWVFLLLHAFFSMHFFHGFFSVGFGGGPRTW